jgi:hypothetical protein
MTLSITLLSKGVGMPPLTQALFDSSPLFQWIYGYDVELLTISLLVFFVLLYKRLYIPLLLVSLLLLFFNIFFIVELPTFFFQFFYANKDYSMFIRVVSLIVGIWGLFRSIGEIKTMVLDNERVLDSWNYIVEGGGGREEWVLAETEKFIIDSKMPGIITERKNVSPGFLGEKRKFLVVRHVKYREFHI